MEVITLPQTTALPQRVLGRRARRTINRQLNAVELVVAQKPTAPGKNAKKNRRRRLRRRAANMVTTVIDDQPKMVQYSPSGFVQNPLVPQPLGVSTSRANYVRSVNQSLRSMPRVSPEGLKFLKCAFSAADFDGSGTYGVPDEFSGKSLAVKHRAVSPVSFLANTDVYFLILPIPGYSYFVASTAAGVPPVAGTVWTGISYADYNSLFFPPLGSAATNYNASKFRFVSQHVEIVPTVNNNSWTGSVQAWKLPLNVTERATNVTTDDLTISGLSGVTVSNADMYSAPFNLGVYAGCFNKGSTAWDFVPTTTSRSLIPESVVAGTDFGQLASQAGLFLPGFDNNFESIVIKVSGIGANTLNSCLLKTWACVEYQFTPGTVMYESQNLHDSCDETAMKLYRKVVKELPVGVSFLDNESFWQRVLNIIRNVSGGLSLLPGPYGGIARGVNLATSGIQSLVL